MLVLWPGNRQCWPGPPRQPSRGRHLRQLRPPPAPQGARPPGDGDAPAPARDRRISPPRDHVPRLAQPPGDRPRAALDQPALALVAAATGLSGAVALYP